MTRDTMLDSIDMAHPTSSFRRRTMAAGEMKDFLGIKSSEPTNCGINNTERSSPVAAPRPTRRLSIGEALQAKIYDWEQPRLAIEGFVADYFSYRIQQKGLEWYEAPELPEGVQPEHRMMRTLGEIFEKKHSEEFENFSEQLLIAPRVTFSIYQEVVQTVGNAQSDTCPMSYGRLIGLISFGGMVAAKMMENEELQGQVRNLSTYTSLFIKSRIRQYWKEHNRSWEDFMVLGENMKDAERAKERRSQRNRRWSIGVGMTAGAVGIMGMVVCGRMIFHGK